MASVSIQDATLLRLLDPSSGSAPTSGALGRTGSMLGPLVSKAFTFDRVHDYSPASSPPSRTEDVYAQSVRSVVAQVVEGRSACLLAAGASCTDKTRTIAGDADTRGLVAASLEEMFAAVQKRSDVRHLYQIAVTLVQVRGEQVRDLFYFDGTPLRVATSATTGHTRVAGARRVRIRSLEQIAEVASLYRASTTTSAAHTVLTVEVDHLDLELAGSLAATGDSARLPECVELVATLQIACLAASELALAGAHTKVPPAAASASTARDLALASRAHARDPSLVKQARVELDRRHKDMTRLSRDAAERTIGVPAAAHSAAASSTRSSSSTLTPTPAADQKALSRAFEALEHVLFQILATPTTPTQANTSTTRTSAASPHISFRSCKLTWILAETLAGAGASSPATDDAVSSSSSSSVVLLHFVSPLLTHLNATLGTLRSGARIAERVRARREKDLAASSGRIGSASARTRRARLGPDATAEAVSRDDQLSDELARHLADATPQFNDPSLRDAIAPDLLNSRAAYTATRRTHARPDAPMALDEYLRMTREPFTDHTTSDPEAVPISIVPSLPSDANTSRGYTASSVVERTPHSQQWHAPTPARDVLDISTRSSRASPSSVSSHSIHAPTSSASMHVASAATAAVAARPPHTSTSPGAPSIASAASPSPSADALPTRLFDVLDLLRGARVGGKDGDGVAAAESWPYQRDVVLAELADQLAAWQHQSPRAKTGGGPPNDAERASRHTSPNYATQVHGAPDTGSEDDLPVAFERSLRGAAARTLQPDSTTTTSTQALAGLYAHSNSESRTDSPNHTSTAAAATTITQDHLLEAYVPVADNAHVEDVAHTSPLGPRPDKSSSRATTSPAAIGNPSAIPDDAWMRRHVSSVKAEMRALTDRLAGLAAHLPPHSAEADSYMPATPTTRRSYAAEDAAHDYVSVSPGARVADPSAVDSFATFRAPTGEVTRLAVRAHRTPPEFDHAAAAKAAAARVHASTHSEAHAFAARSNEYAPTVPAAASYRHTAAAAFGTPPGATFSAAAAAAAPSSVSPASSVSSSSSASSRARDFERALVDRAQLADTLRQAEELARRIEAARARSDYTSNAQPQTSRAY